MRVARLRSPAFVAAALASVALAGCGGDGDASTDEPLRVVASFYPLEEAAREIGGDRVAITDLTPLGGAPHSVVPSPESIKALERSQVVLYLGGGFQPDVAEAVEALPKSVRRVDLLTGQELRQTDELIPGVRSDAPGSGADAPAGGPDPHLWTDPARFVAMADQVKQALIAADPDGRDTYERNAARYLGELRKVDAEFGAALTGCTAETLLTSHAAFGYLADRFGLTQAPFTGISPQDEPDARSLAAIAKYAKARELTTLFFDSSLPEALATEVTGATAARPAVLNPVEGRTKDDLDAKATYASIQRANLRSLVAGLGCTAR